MKHNVNSIRQQFQIVPMGFIRDEFIMLTEDGYLATELHIYAREICVIWAGSLKTINHYSECTGHSNCIRLNQPP